MEYLKSVAIYDLTFVMNHRNIEMIGAIINGALSNMESLDEKNLEPLL